MLIMTLAVGAIAPLVSVALNLDQTHLTIRSHIMYITHHVHHTSCTSHIMYITHHVHHTSCTSHTHVFNLDLPRNKISSILQKQRLLHTHATLFRHYIANGSSMYVTMLDASKAFDKVNHSKLFTKLIDWGYPSFIVRILYYVTYI